jgi:hypothetical protein
MARKIITTRKRDEKTHELRTFVFRQPMKGVRGVKKTAVVFEVRDGNVCAFRHATKGERGGNTLEIVIDRGHRFYAGSAQPAEYYAHSRDGAVAQFLRDMPGWVVL